MILVLIVFSALNAEAQNQAPTISTLETVNAFAGQWCCANDGYIYGTGVDPGSGTHNYVKILRKRETGQSYEVRGDVTTVDPSFRIFYRIFSTSTPGLIFVPVINTSRDFSLLKSNDGGATFTNVFNFGEGNGPNGTNAPYVRLLRGVLELTRELPGGGGLKTLFIGEYNVSSGRIPGSINDRVRIMKSVDNGSTWTKVVEWNTNGSNQVGHIHAIKQDPYTGDVYICTGDANSKAGIIKWDGVSPWSDNKTLAEISTMKGFRVHTGSQRYRVCDVLFDNNHFYTFADTQTPNNPTGSESGIWRGTKDFSSYTRVDNQIFDYDPMHIGWYGEKIGNTFIFTTSREYEDPVNAWKELNTQIYVSNDGVHWHKSGVINWRDRDNPSRSDYVTNVFSYNNKMYIDCSGAAGHSSTIQCELARQWKPDDDPVILHPVFFTGNWNSSGNDNNAGTSADAPKLTLNNILSNRIPAGARVRIAAGTYNEPALYPQWMNNYLKGRGSVVIEGKGMDETRIIRSGAGSTYGIRVEASRVNTNSVTPLVLKDLEISVTADGGAEHTNYVINNVDSYVKTIGCRIGSPTNDDSPLVMLAGEVARYVSENSVHIANRSPGNHKNIVSSGAPNTTINLENCIVNNGYNAIVSSFSGINLKLVNCTFSGIENSALVLQQGSDMQPFVKNCIFNCQGAPIADHAGIAENSVDYNLYSRANINVTDGGHSLAIGTDPMFIDEENGNFNLQMRSPCIVKGTFLAEVLYDYANQSRYDPPCIGAFEKIVLFAEPSDIVISPPSGSTGEISIISNTAWSVSVDVPWLNHSSPTGTGSSTIVTTAITSNSSKGSRIANLVISSPELSPVNVIVRQLCDIVTDCSETKGGELNVYPNPVSGMLNVDYKDSIFSFYNILNLNGQKISNEKVIAPLQRIDFSKYAKGLYILEFITNTGAVKRVIVVNK